MKAYVPGYVINRKGTRSTWAIFQLIKRQHARNGLDGPLVYRCLLESFLFIKKGTFWLRELLNNSTIEGE